MSLEAPWFGPLLRPELAAMRSYVPTVAPPGAVRLDANESPYGLLPDEQALLADALAAVDTHRYPDVRATRLRELIAAHADAHPDEVVLGCGSDEVIALLINALAHPPPGVGQSSVVYPDPSFVMYRLSALAHGVRPVAVPLDPHWDLDVEAIARAVGDTQPSVVFLPSPNNPTGNLFTRSRIEAVIAAAPRSLVLLDEAYGPFSGESYTALRKAHPQVGQLQTISKLGMAAARVGWAILPRALALEVDKVRQPYNLNTLSQRAAELCLTVLRPAFDRSIARIVSERGRLHSSLAAIHGVVVYPSAANFLWVSFPVNAGVVHEGLMHRGVVVRSFHAAGGRLATMLRVTVGTPAENDAFLAALTAAL